MIKYYRTMKNVNRLSRQPIHREYNLLEHSYMVTVLFRYWAKVEDVPYGMPVIDYVLNHDIVEAVTGDLAYDVKNINGTTKDCWKAIELAAIDRHPALAKYTDYGADDVFTSKRQYNLFKICDLLDLWIFCMEEAVLGNKSSEIQKVIDTCELLIKTMSNEVGGFPMIAKYMENYIY